MGSHAGPDRRRPRFAPADAGAGRARPTWPAESHGRARVRVRAGPPGGPGRGGPVRARRRPATEAPRMTRRRRGAVPAGPLARATSWCTSSTASPATAAWSAARSPTPSATTCCSSTRRATGCTCPPTWSGGSRSTSGGESPRLSRLGSDHWAKEKAPRPPRGPGHGRRAGPPLPVRMSVQGHAFAPDTPWQRELEDAFPHDRDARPAHHHRRGQARHGVRAADGPADLRRRRLRQDRDRGARRVQGRAGRQAGRGPRADHAAGRAALPDVLASASRRSRCGSRCCRGSCRAGRAGATSWTTCADGQGRRGHRHPPAAVAGREVQGPRAAGRRRGAALRRGAQGAAEEDPRVGGRADDDRHAHPADPRDGADRRPRDLASSTRRPRTASRS